MRRLSAVRLWRVPQLSMLPTLRPGPGYGDGPITEQQIRDKLTADGFSNIQISPQGSLFETIATKNGRALRLAIDSQSRTVFQARGADDDDDD